MIRTLVIADSGATMAAITSRLSHAVGVEIVAYASGAAPAGAVVSATRPNVVLVSEMHRPGLGALRISEVHAAEPDTVIVGLADRVEGKWAPEALRAGAAAVVPSDLEPATLSLVLHEALEQARGRMPSSTHTTAERSAA